ncbi:MAG: Threonine dehydrogenase and related Zn-dependent dehydrogenases [uncultured Paraburkholderia sp.]|nr:MAG: Threonine dehydrogenase and related Zn-dependent dehydrogenases [uncultured Paraburkholderia sp.]
MARTWARSPSPLRRNSTPGDTVAVFGCGPVGQFAIASAKLMGAGRIFAIDCVDSRLAMAREQGDEIVNFDKEDPVQTVKSLTDGIGVNCAIDAVGVDAMHAHAGPAAQQAEEQKESFEQEGKKIAPHADPHGAHWRPGDAPSQTLQWAVQALAKAGTLSIIGVYPPADSFFTIGMAMNKNLTIRMGNCNHRKYVPELVEMVCIGKIDPSKILTQCESMSNAIEAFKAFGERQPGLDQGRAEACRLTQASRRKRCRRPSAKADAA